MKPIPSILIANMARTDLARISNELYDLQRQTASGARADDLAGFGAGAGRIVSARTAIANHAARIDAASRLASRLDVQDIALGRAAEAAAQLKADVMSALASDDATYLAGQLQNAFAQATNALNTQYEGVPLFAGERRGGAPVTAQTLDELSGLVSSSALYDESDRTPTLDLGFGAPITVADKASDVSRSFYEVVDALNDMLAGEPVGHPLTADQRTRLVNFAKDIDGAHRQMLEAQGRNGDMQARVGKIADRLTAESNLLEKQIGDAADADLAEVAMKLAAAQTQYQAAAKVFSQIKDLSLINFLD